MVESDGPSEVRGHLGHLKVLEELSGILQHYHLVQDERGRTEREGGIRGGERDVESIAVPPHTLYMSGAKVVLFRMYNNLQIIVLPIL